MHLGKFHNILWQLREDEQATNLLAHFQALVASLNQLASSPTSESYAASYKAALEAFRNATSSSRFLNPSPIDAAYLKEIKAVPNFGVALFDSVIKIISENQLAATVASTELSKLYAQVHQYYASLGTVDEVFTSLAVELERDESGRCEIGIAVPFTHGTKTLKDLSKEANEWHNALSPIAELFDSENADIKLDFMSSSNWQFYLIATPLVILGISTTLKSVNKVLSELITMKSLLKQLVGTGVSDNLKGIADAEISNKLSNGIRSIADEAVEERYVGSDTGRKNELKNALSQSMKFMAKKIVDGATVEVKCIPPDMPDTSADSGQTAEQKLEQYQAAVSISNTVKLNMELLPLDIAATLPLGLEFDDIPIEESQLVQG